MFCNQGGVDKTVHWKATGRSLGPPRSFPAVSNIHLLLLKVPLENSFTVLTYDFSVGVGGPGGGFGGPGGGFRTGRSSGRPLLLPVLKKNTARTTKNTTKTTKTTRTTKDRLVQNIVETIIYCVLG